MKLKFSRKYKILFGQGILFYSIMPICDLLLENPEILLPFIITINSIIAMISIMATYVKHAHLFFFSHTSAISEGINNIT